MADINDLENQIKKTATTNLRRFPPQEPLRTVLGPAPTMVQPAMPSVLEACERAAEIVRNVHASHEAEGEKLAEHLEQIGNTFLKMCQEAAKQVRDLRIMPKQMAEDTAKDLLSLGQQEEQRHKTVTDGLISARDALLAIGQAPSKQSEK